MTWPSGNLAWQISKKWQVVFPWRLDRFFSLLCQRFFWKKNKNAGFQSMFSSSSPSPLSAANLPEISWTRNNFFSTWHVAGRIGNLPSFGSSLNKMAGGKTANMDRTCSHSCQVSSLKQSNQTHWNNRWKECSSNFYKLMVFWKPKHVLINFSSDHLWPSFLANSIRK